MSSRKAAAFRIRIIMGVVLFLAGLLILRLYYLQVVKHEALSGRGEGQYVHTVQDLYDRGTIYFTTRDGEKIAAATVKSGYVLAVDPGKIKNAEEVYEALKDYISLDRETFIYRATLTDRVYVEIESKLDEETAKKIEAKEIDGVQLYRQRWRYYPGEALAARTVGFVAYEGKGTDDNLIGRYGLERFYDSTLTRETERKSVDFFAELFTNLGNLVFDNKEKDQGDIVTTIEPTVARMLQTELQKVNDQWGSKMTGGIIINPKTGAIYAMEAVPTFDSNNRGTTTIETFRNPMVEDVYELGSIIKALTMAAGLDSGAVSPSTTYYDAGSLDLDTWTIHNYDKRGRGTVNMQAVLNQSLNTGVAFIVKTMGKERFREYFLDLKLGSESGIDLPGEIPGLVSNLESPRSIEYATASFGQGIALTPIAAVRALSALGNGGTLITPHLLASTELTDGTVKEKLFPEGDRVWSEETSETVTRMLVKVVDEALRGGDVALPNYSIAAKTGTAQLVKPEGGYYDDRYLHSFFGYFPAYDPEFLVFLYTEDPRGVTYASDTLTDSFMNITKFLINYYNVPPDR